MQKLDLDLVRQDDAAYWVCALVLAIQSKNRQREKSARENIRRLGYDLIRCSDMVSEGAK